MLLFIFTWPDLYNTHVLLLTESDAVIMWQLCYGYGLFVHDYVKYYVVNQHILLKKLIVFLLYTAILFIYLKINNIFIPKLLSFY
jgi:hypothetical protein